MTKIVRSAIILFGLLILISCQAKQLQKRSDFSRAVIDFIAPLYLEVNTSVSINSAGTKLYFHSNDTLFSYGLSGEKEQALFLGSSKGQKVDVFHASGQIALTISPLGPTELPIELYLFSEKLELLEKFKLEPSSKVFRVIDRPDFVSIVKLDSAEYIIFDEFGYAISVKNDRISYIEHVKKRFWSHSEGICILHRDSIGTYADMPHRVYLKDVDVSSSQVNILHNNFYYIKGHELHSIDLETKERTRHSIHEINPIRSFNNGFYVVKTDSIIIYEINN